MNDFEIKLDRLADGELRRVEYAALLTSLDHEEEGWKKCALVLLESQALRTELLGLVAEPPQVTSHSLDRNHATGPALESSHRRGWSYNMLLAQAFALAACLGAAFWLGRDSVTPLKVSSDDNQVAIGKQPLPDPEVVPATRPHQGQMTLVINDADGRPRELQVPVVDGNYVDPHAVLSRSAAIPPEVLEAIARSGHKFESQRAFMRRPIDDDHELVVPVDRLRVVPVSNPMY